MAYRLAGWLATWLELETALILLSGLCALTTLAATRVWPATDPVEQTHSHAYFVDKLHPTWAKYEAAN